jgi:hypothetical protein
MLLEEDYEFSLEISHHNEIPLNAPLNSSINCLYLNAQSLRNSLSDLQNFIDTLTFRIDIVCVVETWIKENEKIYFNLLNYQSFHSIRSNSNGGGASIFINKDFDVGIVVYEESITI